MVLYDQREAHMANPTYDPREPDPGVEHRLELTVYELKSILDMVERAKQAKLRFTGELVIGKHRVSVRWKPGVDQRDGDELLITGIRRVC